MFGADPPDAGTVSLEGQVLPIRSPRDAIAHGIAYLSEDRKGEGLALAMTVAQNVSMANPAGVANALGFIRFAREAAVAQRYVDSLVDPHAVDRARRCACCRAATSRRW